MYPYNILLRILARLFLSVSVLTIAFAALFSLQVIPTSSQVSSDPVMSLDVIERLNAWRMSENIAPLRVNADLSRLAFEQASYLIRLPVMPLSGDLHKDANGKLPPQRALSENWPTYGLSARVAVGENAAQGNATFALDFWLHSDIHRKTALNPAYREVGVAVLPYEQTYLIIAEFGARPDILPAFVFPEQGTIYFTNEQYAFKTGGSWVQNVTAIELFDANGKSLLSTPSPFVADLPLPPITTSSLDVVYHDGSTVVTHYTVNLKSDVVLLPRKPSTSTPAPTGSAPTSSAPVVTVTATAPTSTPDSRVVRSATLASAGVATQSVSALLEVDHTPVVLIVYNQQALYIVNATDKYADLSMFALRYQTHTIPATRWQAISDVILTSFPAEHCLMFERAATDSILPENCKSLRSVISMQPSQMFWEQGDFDVLRGDKVLATCKQNTLNQQDSCSIPWTK